MRFERVGLPYNSFQPLDFARAPFNLASVDTRAEWGYNRGKFESRSDHVGQTKWSRRRCNVAKYLVQAKYTDQGLKGLLTEGGSARREAVDKAVKSLGGTLEVFYYAFGDADVIGIVDLPDNVSATTFSLMVAAGGGATLKTIVLITPEEVDQAAKKTLDYRPPGQ
jgi:uncharacterized protein with GYD domain